MSKMFSEFQRTSSSASSTNDDNSVQSYRALLKERLLITQPNDDNDDDMFDFRESRMSRDTDYETDLDMDYDGEFVESALFTDEVKQNVFRFSTMNMGFRLIVWIDFFANSYTM